MINNVIIDAHGNDQNDDNEDTLLQDNDNDDDGEVRILQHIPGYPQWAEICQADRVGGGTRKLFKLHLSTDIHADADGYHEVAANADGDAGVSGN